ncbi:tyrosine-type recombinase/integrase [Notoacmeibacter ruber]|uniref:DUF4102 domain-containing protein n=1 Tax=Notoacmeibacter ruber TaxID=2670375 RepID=A0A3L7JFU9_9HYPH|nr:integrase arm-type DNA-binding domain-containing protein [Notoacmeibacter ruber]RLQ89647.1 DUF4102 domain-containing protein [Notoacmeibacter ruber]
MPLTDTKIRNLKAAEKPIKHSDGGGLHLLVTANGSKLWRLNYRFYGKQKTLYIGAWPAVSLADARLRRESAKKLLAQSIDPAAQAKHERIERQANFANTFGAIADEVLERNEKEGLAAVTINKKRWLIDLVRPALGKRPVRDITAPELLNELRKVEAKGNYETARRLRAVCGQVFRYAVITSRADFDPSAALRGALISPTVTSQAAITEWGKFGGLLRAIWGYDGHASTRYGLQLLALLYPRPGELRQAEWSEIDLEAGVWTIPAQRAKMRREHRKPLSKEAADIFAEVHKLNGFSKYVFPAIHTTQRPLSENTFNAALRRMGFDKHEMTSHGFRASASTLLNESGRWNPDAIEAELGHVGADEVRRAYHRALYWDERVRMTGAWAAQISEAVGISAR